MDWHSAKKSPPTKDNRGFKIGITIKDGENPNSTEVSYPFFACYIPKTGIWADPDGNECEVDSWTDFEYPDNLEAI